MDLIWRPPVAFRGGRQGMHPDGRLPSVHQIALARPLVLYPRKAFAGSRISHRLQINAPRIESGCLHATASASWTHHPVLSDAEKVAKYAGKLPRPAALPKPPRTANLADVLPYLLKIATSDQVHTWRLVLSFMLLVTSKSTGILAPVYFKHAVDALSGMGAGAAGTIALTHRAAVAAVTALLLSGLCRAVNSVAKELQGPVFTPVAQAAARRVAYHTFAHVLDLDTSFHLERRTGALSRILERGTRSTNMIFRAVAFTFFPTVVELTLVTGLLATTFSPLVAGLVVLTFVAYVGWTFFQTQAATEARKAVNLMDNLTSGKAVDVLLNYETVKLFGNQGLEVQQYDEYLVGYQRAYVTTEAIAATLNTGQALILTGGLTAVSIAAVLGGIGGGAITAGNLVMAQGLLLQVFGPLQFLGFFYRELRQSLVDMEAFLNILTTLPKLPDGKQRLPEEPIDGANHERSPVSMTSLDEEQASISGRGLQVKLRNVKFGYTSARQVLRGVSLHIAPGESVAIVGPSGSGKSTILRLLMRLYDVDEGSVEFNGVDVRQLRQKSLRGAVAVVPQDSVLFNDTIMRNIAYGRVDASEADIVDASKMARLHDAIMGMPDGYQTMVGERGLKLSGGEKQRIAIARAFLRRPRLLICDEATSALDTATERSIMQSLNELAQGRTSLFVAHRLSTIRGCDRIVVMSQGRVVEEGTHDQLMQQGQVYADMWKMQASAEEQLMREEGSAGWVPDTDEDDDTGASASGAAITTENGGGGNSGGSSGGGGALTAAEQGSGNEPPGLPAVGAQVRRTGGGGLQLGRSMSGSGDGSRDDDDLEEVTDPSTPSVPGEMILTDTGGFSVRASGGGAANGIGSSSSGSSSSSSIT